MDNSKILKRKTLCGLFWTFSDLVMNQGTQFVIQIILARLLLPEDFGLIGMIIIVISISNSIVDSGFANALIREKNVSRTDYSTVFLFNLIISIFIYIIIFLLAPSISRFYNEPRLIELLRVLGVTVIINSFGLVQRTILTKKINFKTQTKINLVSTVISGGAGILFAFVGFGVWSLVIRSIIQSSLQAILLNLSNKWKPSFIFDFNSFKKFYGFGWKLLVSGLINTLYNNIYYIIIGKSFSISELGYYTNASKLKDMATQSLNSAIQKVTYPVLSNLNDNDLNLKISYRKILRAAAFIIFPIVIGLSAIANPLIRITYGEKWIGSIIFFQILCFEGMLYPIHSINLNVLQVKGRSDLFLKLEVIKKILAILIITTTLFYKLGIIYLLYGAIINSYISYFINAYYTRYLINYSIKDQIIDLLPSFISSIGMLVGVYLFDKIFPSNFILGIFCRILIGSFIYLIINIVLKTEELVYLNKKLKKYFNNKVKKDVFYE